MRLNRSTEADLPLSALTAISPLDGRYARLTSVLRSTVSEYGLMRYRVLVEVEWLKTLAQDSGVTGLAQFTTEASAVLDNILTSFDLSAAAGSALRPRAAPRR